MKHSTKADTDRYYAHQARKESIKIFLAALIVAIIAMAVLSCSPQKYGCGATTGKNHKIGY